MTRHWSDDPSPEASSQVPRFPRWVAVFGIVLALLVVLAVAAMLLGTGEHGPGRHLSVLGPPGTGAGPPASGDRVVP